MKKGLPNWWISAKIPQKEIEKTRKETSNLMETAMKNKDELYKSIIDAMSKTLEKIKASQDPFTVQILADTMKSLCEACENEINADAHPSR